MADVKSGSANFKSIFTLMFKTILSTKFAFRREKSSRHQRNRRTEAEIFLCDCLCGRDVCEIIPQTLYKRSRRTDSPWMWKGGQDEAAATKGRKPEEQRQLASHQSTAEARSAAHLPSLALRQCLPEQKCSVIPTAARTDGSNVTATLHESEPLPSAPGDWHRDRATR